MSRSLKEPSRLDGFLFCVLSCSHGIMEVSQLGLPAACITKFCSRNYYYRASDLVVLVLCLMMSADCVARK